ncbi:MAG: FdhF/YdeP family oxidoreductase [Xanthobacteraceae bacterium]|nr:FdhF/YdeP family oxidoreductase [Xanthobacteraceae bacterium]
MLPRFESYSWPAGGWGALRATANALREQGVVGKGGKALLSMNQPDGFDCPGCAWPDPKHTSSFEFCENGAKAVAFELTSRRVTREFFAAHSVRELEQRSDYWLEEQGRLTEPMRYDAASDHYVPIAWDDAFALIGRELRALDSPDEAEFYTSGRTSNEAAFLYQLFVRKFGTNNFPDCSNMCHEPTSVGLPESIGVGKGTVLLDDFEHADAIFIIGQNPGTNSPRMLTSLHNASRRGVPIVVLNPLRERALERFAAPQNPVEMVTLSSTRIASEYCQVSVGGDIAALKGIMKIILETHDAAGTDGIAILDLDFIAEHTHGFEAFTDDLRRTSWDDIVRVSGLTRDQLERAAAIYMKAKAVIVCYGMGITQHRHGSENVQQIVNLLLLRGNFGRPGAGICPVRGHSNVQGDRTMGIDEKPKPELLEQIEKVFGFKPPQRHGHAVVDAIGAMIAGTAKVFIGLGGNFVAAVPDKPITEAAMRRLRLTVGVSTKLNRGHLVHGEQALILPCLARSDIDMQATGRQAITVEDSMSMVHASSGLVHPPSDQLKSEVAIVCGIARATLPADGVDWSAFEADYDVIRDRIEAVFPDLFHDFNKRIRQPGGFHLHIPPRERVWNTPTGRANFLIFVGVAEDPAVANKSVLRLTTLRSHNQYNTTIYGLDDRYRGVFGGRMVVFMNEHDMKQRNIAPGSLVELESIASDGQRRRVRGFKVLPYAIPQGSIGAYYPETNPLLPLDFNDVQSKTPAAKSIPVLVRPE